VIPIHLAGNGPASPVRGGVAISLRWRALTGRRALFGGQVGFLPGKVSNELVHIVDLFTTLALAAGASVPTDRQIDRMNMREFLLGDGEQSGRDTVLCLQGNRLQAVRRQWKIHLFQQDNNLSTFAPYNAPHIHNLEWDPREEHEVDFRHGWVLHPIAAAAAAFLKSLTIEPPIKAGTPDPYSPPPAGGWHAEEALQIGPIIQYVTSLAQAQEEPPGPHSGLSHTAG
jgi:arylsulfatase